MTRLRFAVLWLISLWGAALCQGQIGSGKYRDSGNHFEIKAAPGWSRANADAIGDANGRSLAAYPNRTWTITAGWCRAQDVSQLLLPFVQVEVTPIDLSTMRYADVERAFAAETVPELAGSLGKPLAQLIGQLPTGTVVVDRQRGRLFSKETSKEGRVSTTYVVVGFLGSRGAVHLVFGCDTNLLTDYLPEFQKFVDGFEWDQGFAYSEPSQSGKGNNWNSGRSKSAGKSGTRSRSGTGDDIDPAEAKRMGKLLVGGCGLTAVIVVIVIVVIARR